MADETTAPRGLTGLIQSLGRSLGDARLAVRAAELAAAHAPDERLALALLTRLAEIDAPAIAAALGDDQSASDLNFCLGSSEVIGDFFSTQSDRWRVEFGHARSAGVASLQTEIGATPDVPLERRAAGEALAAFKRRLLVHISIADLLDRIEVSDTARLMSLLADACIKHALEAARKLMGPRAGPAGDFCVVAMGKLGARELNLSSDIDLIYLYDSRDEKNGPLAAARLGELLTELLSAGCFRVDLRLRPGGPSAALVASLDGALNFYQNYGQTWERAALLRARPVAGAVELGHRLVDELSRFVFRRYLDFDTLRQLRVMKRQIEAELRSPALIERNIKLGRGGIRELEFIVQALELIYGGRDPRIRTEKTTDALQRFGANGYLPADRADALARAYLFLRDVEHKLQVVAGLQTHTLPIDRSALCALAARMGLGKDDDAAARFTATMRGHRELIASHFRQTLAGGDDAQPARIAPAAAAAWRSARDPEAALIYLEALGFSDSAGSVAHLEFFARGPAHAPASPRRRELLDRLGPVLLDEIAKLPDPDLALMNLASFIGAIGARTSFLALLEEHPATRRVLLRLFASSRHLSTIFIRHPDMLDTLVRSDLAQVRRHPAGLQRELGGILAACPDFESKLDALRAFRHQEFLRIAIADLSDELDLPAVEQELTALAETVLCAALDLARVEVALRHRVPAQLALCAIAMGRLGAAEMSYNSDLDLIFVFDDSGGAAPAAREAASRIVQKLIAILQSRTREGYVYKLDLRLRPSGNQGPLVASLDGFIQYHRESSAVWERQALIRGRVIAGDATLGASVEAARAVFVYGRGLRDGEVAEIAAMRARMEREIGAETQSRLNLKQGRGGLLDVEFMTQMLALRYGKDFAALRERSTAPLIRALGETGVLDPAVAAQFASDYRFLVRLENRLRIESDQSAWAVPTDPQGLTPLARRMGFAGANSAARLLEELHARRARIRVLFNRTFAGESARGL
ncbi:MAG: bifunctional [glutamate--ammonia ligase]-adenylyl-L-tyrosine phosphorylase/[glutamate--ammonia-ligase] adenylyltransferase [Candidatus Binataceae bacterium]